MASDDDNNVTPSAVVAKSIQEEEEEEDGATDAENDLKRLAELEEIETCLKKRMDGMWEEARDAIDAFRRARDKVYG